MGLRFPPRAERTPRHTCRVVATGDRLWLRLPETMPSWVVLHEIAHAMTSTHDGSSDGHGPVFVGIYVDLHTEVSVGDLIETQTGRKYAVVSVRRQERGRQ